MLFIPRLSDIGKMSCLSSFLFFRRCHWFSRVLCTVLRYISVFEFSCTGIYYFCYIFPIIVCLVITISSFTIGFVSVWRLSFLLSSTVSMLLFECIRSFSVKLIFSNVGRFFATAQVNEKTTFRVRINHLVLIFKKRHDINWKRSKKNF